MRILTYNQWSKAWIATSKGKLIWFKGAYSNLRKEGKELLYKEGWAIGCWFVPVINLYRPYKIMRELYSSKALAANLLNSWWALWILNSIIAQFSNRLSLKAHSAEELITATFASIAGNIVGIPLALITIKVIKTYSEAETGTETCQSAFQSGQ